MRVVWMVQSGGRLHTQQQQFHLSLHVLFISMNQSIDLLALLRLAILPITETHLKRWNSGSSSNVVESRRADGKEDRGSSGGGGSDGGT